MDNGRGVESLVLERGRGEGNGDEGPGMRIRGWEKWGWEWVLG